LTLRLTVPKQEELEPEVALQLDVLQAENTFVTSLINSINSRYPLLSFRAKLEKFDNLLINTYGQGFAGFANGGKKRKFVEQQLAAGSISVSK